MMQDEAESKLKRYWIDVVLCLCHFILLRVNLLITTSSDS